MASEIEHGRQRRAELAKLGVRHRREVRIARRAADAHELVRVRDRERTEEESVDETEHGDVRADAGGDRQHGHDRERGRTAQSTQGETEIAHEDRGLRGDSQSVLLIVKYFVL